MWKLAIILSIALAVSAYPADYKYDDAEELEHEFQGDMIISQQELDAFNGLITENTRWPSNIVPYTINPSHFSKNTEAHKMLNINSLRFHSCSTNFIYSLRR